MKKFGIVLSLFAIFLALQNLVWAKIPSRGIVDGTITSADIINTYCSSMVSVSVDPTNAGTVTTYVNLVDNTSTDNTETGEDLFQVPVAMYASNLRVKADGSTASIKDPYTVYLRDDAANTVLTCGISGTGIDSCTDTSNTATLAAGSKLTVSVSTTGSLADPTDVSELLMSFCLTQ